MAGASVTQNSGTRRGFSNADNHSRHEWRNFGGVLQMSIYDEMRALASLDLTRNEMKVWLIYRAEMDEAARQVRGKTAECLRSKTDLGRAQFAAASAGLQAKGIIETRRQRNAAQVIFVPELKPESPESPDIQETHNSEKPGCPGNPAAGSPGFPAVGSPGNPDHDILAAPVSTPKSTPTRERAGDDDLPSHVKPVANWSQAFAQPGDSHGVELANGRLTLVNGTRTEWLERFDGDAKALDLALIEAAGEIQPNSRSHSLKAQVLRALARKVRDRLDRDRRYAAAASAKAAPKKPPPGAKPTFNRTTGEIVWRHQADA